MKKITVFFIALFFLASCGSSKDAFTLKKRSSSDEFLVEKKKTLVLPPDYGKLPIPQDSQINNNNEIEDEEINILINNDSKNLSSTVEKDSKSTSIEKSILEKIE